MSQKIFAKALAFTLRWEGGLVNDPLDRGGETNRGITQSTYNQYRMLGGLPARSVQLLNNVELEDIYYTLFWQPARCEILSSKLARCHFDWSVNAGVSRGIRTLQQVIGTVDDGIVGPKTKRVLARAMVKERGRSV